MILRSLVGFFEGLVVCGAGVTGLGVAVYILSSSNSIMLDDTVICQAAKATLCQLILRSLVGFFEGFAVCGAGVTGLGVAVYILSSSNSIMLDDTVICLKQKQRCVG